MKIEIFQFFNGGVNLFFQATSYMIWTRFKLPFVGEIRFNPVVSAGSILLILLFVTTSIAWRQDSPFTKVIFNVAFTTVACPYYNSRKN